MDILGKNFLFHPLPYTLVDEHYDAMHLNTTMMKKEKKIDLATTSWIYFLKRSFAMFNYNCKRNAGITLIKHHSFTLSSRLRKQDLVDSNLVECISFSLRDNWNVTFASEYWCNIRIYIYIYVYHLHFHPIQTRTFIWQQGILKYWSLWEIG